MTSIQALRPFVLGATAMDGLNLTLFLIATFFGGLTSGLTGFAAGLVVSGVWLHIISPIQTAVLIAAYGVVNQGYGIWKVRHALKWRRVLPFVIGGAVGVPLGAYLLTYANPALSADRRRRAAGRLRVLQSGTADIHPGQLQRDSRSRHRRLERPARRPHRPWRSHQHGLGVSSAADQKTRNVPCSSRCCS